MELDGLTDWEMGLEYAKDQQTRLAARCADVMARIYGTGETSAYHSDPETLRRVAARFERVNAKDRQ